MPTAQTCGVELGTSLGRVTLPSPVLAASGCAGYGPELARFIDLAELGAIVTKSVMLRPRAGRPTPRMAETTGGMLNAIGLQGPGIEQFLAVDLPWLVERGVRAAVSIAGSTVDEYAELARQVGDTGAAQFLELNISCPNVDRRGQVFACDPVAAATVVAAVRASAPAELPVFAKLTADVTDIVAVARACVDAGADGLTLINTLLGSAVDVWAMRPALPAVTGGLSGPAIRPIAVRCIWQVHAALPAVPIIGGGGVFSGLDALELILAGASAVAVGTANFRDPGAGVRIRDDLADALAERDIARLTDAIGLAHHHNRNGSRHV
jgi:dihydroorotate dehydrogenase (NAD+) catalytic subunit